MKLSSSSDKKAGFYIWYGSRFTIGKNKKMKIILKVLLTALAVVILANILPNITIDNYGTAILVALTISILNMFVRPLLVFFTLPATIITLGLFLFVINAVIVSLAGKIVTGFAVNGFFTALLFSVLLSLFRSLLLKMLESKKQVKLT